jgi:Inner membrane component of T3SS, cytoplasmic domain/Inner membrane component of T3SS, periplasmic domain
MPQMVASASIWRFEVADGPNAGASVTLAPGRYRLGSAADNDIVLADPAVSASHAMLELAPGRAGITALAPGVMLQRRRLRTGGSRPLTSGTLVTLGTTRMHFSGPTGEARSHGLVPITICLALVSLLGTGIAYRIATPEAVSAEPADPSPAQPGGATTLVNAVTAFRAHLIGKELGGVEVSAADGMVLATGTILPQDRRIWLDAEKWFDARLGDRYALADRVRVMASAELPDLQVAAVAMAPVPNVITPDGQRYMAGAVLRDGWSIDHITPHEITLRSGARKIRITL